MAFIETPRFPVDVSLGSSGGPVFNTDIIEYGAGTEFRNEVWSYPKYRYNAGYNIKNRANAINIYEFFLASGGRANGFRVKDLWDFSSKANQHGTPARTDQTIGTGDGSTTTFQLIKTYAKGSSTRIRPIKKPVVGSVLVEKDGALQTITTDYTIDHTTGIITFVAAPANGHVIKAGFYFDVPVRFDTDDLSQLQFVLAYGGTPDNDLLSYGDVPLLEIRDNF